MPNVRDIKNEEQLKREFEYIKKTMETEGTMRVVWGKPEFLPLSEKIINETQEGRLLIDLNDLECVEAKVSHDEKILWVNTENGCILRIQGIKNFVFSQN